MAAWLEAGLPLAAHRAAAKPFSISPLAFDDNLGWHFEIGLLSAPLEDLLLDAAGSATGISLGGQPACISLPPRKLASLDWGALSEDPNAPHSFRFEFLTPTGNPLIPFHTGIEVLLLLVSRPAFWILRIPSVISGILAVILAYALGSRIRVKADLGISASPFTRGAVPRGLRDGASPGRIAIDPILVLNQARSEV